jgi:tRNA 2-thiouridine synthesizing protein A
MAAYGSPMDETLDLRSLKCPLPALLARKALAKAEPDTMVIVLTDDPLAVVDIPHMCAEEGHAVMAVHEEGGHHSFRIRRGPLPAAAAPLPAQDG